MKNFILIFVISLLSTGSVYASVDGSDHDLTGSGQQLCMACHLPHNAQGQNLWVSVPGGTFSGVADLCYTCHDGSVTTTGSTTIFEQTDEQHIEVGTDCSGEGGCHDVHNQNPNGTGRFVVVERTNGSYCETCHDDTMFPGAEGLGDHTAGLTHFTNGTTFRCEQCHTVHGARVQTNNPAGLTNPILLHNNMPADGYYGNFCVHCHLGIAPGEAVVGTGRVAANDRLLYSEAVNDGTEVRHPSISLTGAFPTGGCDLCHDVHDPLSTNIPYLLKMDNTNSAYCISCHDGSQAPGIGGNTHYIGIPSDISMNNGLTPVVPWANQIDEDGNTGADWPSATANMMVCETCHSVHRYGNTGVEGEYFLRHENGLTNQICSACHIDN